MSILAEVVAWVAGDKMAEKAENRWPSIRWLLPALTITLLVALLIGAAMEKGQ